MEGTSQTNYQSQNPQSSVRRKLDRVLDRYRVGEPPNPDLQAQPETKKGIMVVEDKVGKVGQPKAVSLAETGAIPKKSKSQQGSQDTRFAVREESNINMGA